MLIDMEFCICIGCVYINIESFCRLRIYRLIKYLSKSGLEHCICIYVTVTTSRTMGRFVHFCLPRNYLKYIRKICSRCSYVSFSQHFRIIKSNFMMSRNNAIWPIDTLIHIDIKYFPIPYRIDSSIKTDIPDLIISW